jgi:hypothetical protein
MFSHRKMVGSASRVEGVYGGILAGVVYHKQVFHVKEISLLL